MESAFGIDHGEISKGRNVAALRMLTDTPGGGRVANTARGAVNSRIKAGARRAGAAKIQASGRLAAHGRIAGGGSVASAAPAPKTTQGFSTGTKVGAAGVGGGAGGYALGRRKS